MRFGLVILGLFLMPWRALSQEPFWKAKPEVYEKVVNERRVFVSVTDQTGEEASENIMKLVGGGQINAPKRFTFIQLQDFENLFKNNQFVKKIQVDRKHKFLFIKAEVYGLSNAMKIRWKVDQDKEELSVLSFHIVSGLMSGFRWVLNVEPAENDRTDVGIEGKYSYKEFPLPAFFLKFGLEVIFQRVAIDIRSSVEESLKNESRKREKRQ